MYTHDKKVITTGVSVENAEKALIMLHGRGSTAEDIISLAPYLELKNTAVYAPQANNFSWYPYSFMAEENTNEPALSSALEIISEVRQDIIDAGIPLNRIFFLGFSQGACLTLEYIARNAEAYGGAVAFTGGLAGKSIRMEKYSGDFNHAPVLITTGDPDLHVPLYRVEESAGVLRKLNADVTLKVYKGRQHTISRPEFTLAADLLSRVF